ncbi:hypothetical protein [Oceanobacillus picturae]|uniref:hypothetical protein n=1 Tax=Oceanobacillus picturae TaxID=171693 RepID=UPI000E68D116|nr:hypothetical protein [Oceanobacillus picturae]RIU93308.1 hypothetical protein D1864_07495 [Oceanobacillus picturae]
MTDILVNMKSGALVSVNQEIEELKSMVKLQVQHQQQLIDSQNKLTKEVLELKQQINTRDKALLQHMDNSMQETRRQIASETEEKEKEKKSFWERIGESKGG